MEDILDGIRRVIYKWVNTMSPIVSGGSVSAAQAGDTFIPVQSSRRFRAGDTVMIKDENLYETGLTVKSVPNATTVEMATPILNDWVDGSVLIKTTNEQFIQGIYIGDPEVIPRYPAITINGLSRSSEWMTLESTTERYEIDINVYVLDSMHEAGYRFMLQMTKLIQTGLKRNLIPLAGDYDIISLAEDINQGDTVIKLNNRDTLGDYKRIYIEDGYDSQENWINYIYTAEQDPDGTSVLLNDQMCQDFNTADTSIVIPRRFIYNSWPAEIDYGFIHKGELLKAATIHWFAEEEEMQTLRKDEPKLN
jgi:hypothetical protein